MGWDKGGGHFPIWEGWGIVPGSTGVLRVACPWVRCRAPLYLSDSDLEDDEDGKPAVKHSGGYETHLFDSLPAAGEDKPSHEKNEERVEEGKAVKILDIAFVT